MYPDNEAKKQMIRQAGMNNQLTLDILLKDDILGNLAYVEKISGVIKNIYYNFNHWKVHFLTLFLSFSHKIQQARKEH